MQVEEITFVSSATHKMTDRDDLCTDAATHCLTITLFNFTHTHPVLST